VLTIAELRRTEFARLDAADHAYLDYTGSALYPASLVEAHASMLRDSVLGNPHSENPASLASSALLAEARARVRRFFNADDYEVCFTANASGAIRLVAEGYPFASDSSLLLTADNHNSVNGIREFARRSGATVRYLPLDGELRLCPMRLAPGRGLFALPAQSNFSGAKHPLSLIAAAQDAGYHVLLDAASFVGTSLLDLRAVRPDFVAISFYKMFGFPTGVGALLARRDALATLRRPWFAGGTVEHVTIAQPDHLLRDGAEGFEDGTVNFLALGAVSAGLSWLGRVGVARIGEHAAAHARHLADALAGLRHRRGAPMVRLYGPQSWGDRGAIVTFNALDAAGRIVRFDRVETRARDARVSIRGGCFCNPGAAERAGLGFGSPNPGALRASFGAASTTRDADRLTEVVEEAASRTSPTRSYGRPGRPAPSPIRSALPAADPAIANG
jgi:selenocysteine lyase/cysteine desulfurase